MSVSILNSEQRWECPNCEAKLLVRSRLPHSPFHPCRGLKGLEAPLIPEGTRCKVEAVEREDYVGKENVTYDGEGAPIMRVETTRDDGNDVAVFAPVAQTNSEVN